MNNYPPAPEEPFNAGEPIATSDEEDSEAEEGTPGFLEGREGATVAYRGATSDPTNGYLIAIALSVGLIALIPRGEADLRYSIVWTVLAGFAVLAWLLGHSERIGQEKPENLSWGVVFGLIIGAPLLAFGGGLLTTTVHRLFVDMSKGALLAYLVFAMPTAETLFFRGVMQELRPFWVVGLLSSLWSIVLFFPLIQVHQFPQIAVIIGTALVMMNMIYSYVRERNGLAAAWLCQIVVNLVVLFLPFLQGASS